MIRFADDCVVLVRGTEAQAHAIKKQTAEFMAEQMRLTLAPEKTAITHVDDGFDLLGSASCGLGAVQSLLIGCG
jgi:RNA-directed DNA polymerase